MCINVHNKCKARTKVSHTLKSSDVDLPSAAVSSVGAAKTTEAKASSKSAESLQVPPML